MSLPSPIEAWTLGRILCQIPLMGSWMACLIRGDRWLKAGRVARGRGSDSRRVPGWPP